MYLQVCYFEYTQFCNYMFDYQCYDFVVKNLRVVIYRTLSTLFRISLRFYFRPFIQMASRDPGKRLKLTRSRFFLFAMHYKQVWAMLSFKIPKHHFQLSYIHIFLSWPFSHPSWWIDAFNMISVVIMVWRPKRSSFFYETLWTSSESKFFFQSCLRVLY